MTKETQKENLLLKTMIWRRLNESKMRTHLAFEKRQELLTEGRRLIQKQDNYGIFLRKKGYSAMSTKMNDCLGNVCIL